MVFIHANRPLYYLLEDNIKKTISYLIVIVLLGSLTGCKKLNTPPNLEKAEKFFEKYNEEIMNIVNYMISSEYESISISTANGKMWADFAYHEINDETVEADIEKLFLKNKDIDFYKHDGKYIFITYWIGLSDITSGFSYSINQEDEPVEQFQTSVEQMATEGWYYYISDYNEWRIQKEENK